MHGFIGEGTTTTPFDMVVLNKLSRYHLSADALRRVPSFAANTAYAQQEIREKLVEHRRYTRAHGLDMQEILEWRWQH